MKVLDGWRNENTKRKLSKMRKALHRLEQAPRA